MDKPGCIRDGKAQRENRTLIGKFLALAVLLICGSFAQADVPSGIPQKAAAAMVKAHTWRSDAVLVSIDANDYHTGNVIVRFSFYSPSNSSGLWITGDTMTPVNGEVNWSKDAISGNFMDLPAAVTQARSMGMKGNMDHATLQFWNGMLAWRIAPAFDPNMRVYDVEAISIEPWQRSWDEFVKVVQQLYDKKADPHELGSRFSGKIVHWEGPVEGVVTTNDGKNFIALRMPGKIKTSEGKMLAFDNLLLLVKNGEIKLPDRLRFRVALVTGTAKFPSPVFELIREEEKTTMIEVLLEYNWSPE